MAKNGYAWNASRLPKLDVAVRRMLKAWGNYIDAGEDTVASEDAFESLARVVDILWRINQQDRLSRMAKRRRASRQ